MKKDLMSGTAFGLVSDFKARSEGHARASGKSAKAPIKIPSSLTLMSRLLEEIIKVKIKLDVDIEIVPHNDHELVVKFSPAGKDASPEKNYLISEILKGLAKTEAGKDLDFVPNSRLIIAADKLALYDFLDDAVLETQGLDTPDTYLMANLKGQEFQDYKNQLLLDCVELENKRPEDYTKAFVSIAAKPFINIAEYRANLYLTSTTTLSIALGHIYRCIQREEGIVPSEKDNALIFGGYN